MAVKFKSIKSKLRLLVKALVPRLLFIVHGLICTDLIVWSESEHRYWYLLICLGLIVIEGLFNVLARDGKEFHWFCPSAFLYSIVLIITLTALRLTQMHCLPLDNCKEAIEPTDHFVTKFIFKSLDYDYKHRISFIEQTGMGALIIGRWALPKGSISKEQFLQIVLIYIGTAADILELSEIYDEDIQSMGTKKLIGIYYGTISVWALSISQFAITIALPEEGLKKEEEDDELDDRRAETSYFRSKFPNKVTPMSYMHYKSMLREGSRYESRPSLKRSSRDNSLPGEINIPSSKANPNTLKIISQNAMLLRKSNSSSSLPSTKKQGTSQPNGIIHSEGDPQPNGASASGDSASEDTFQQNVTPSSVYSQDIPGSTKYTDSQENASSKKSNSPEGCSSHESASQRSFKNNTPPSRLQNNFSRNGSTAGSRNVWRRVLNQYTFSKQKKTNKKRHDSETEDNSMGVGKKEIQSCFVKYVELIEMLHPVCMQDGPFFILRIVLLIHYEVSTDMTFLLLGKNFLVIVVSVYRVLILFCSEPKNTRIDMDDPSNRVRAAMDSNRRLSEKHTLKNRQEYLSMYVLNTIQSEANKNRMKNYSALSSC